MRFRTSVTLVLLAGLVLAPSALTADPTPAAQGLVGRTAAWVSQQLHAPVPVRTLRTVAIGEHGREASVTFADNDLAVERTVVEAWAEMAHDPVIWTEDPVETLIHETLHLRPSADPLNEGAVDAVALDLVPAWMRSFLGKGAMSVAVYGGLSDARYPQEVKTIRALSVAATGQRWRSRAARLWRRAYLLADDLTRAQMIEATG